MDIGARLKNLREERGMTLSQIGEKLGVNKATVQRYESGELDVRRTTALKLAECYGVSPSYIMGWTSEDSPFLPSIEPPDEKQPPSTAEAAPGDELEKSVMRLVSELTPDQQDFLHAWLKTTIALRQQKPPSPQE